MAGELDLRVTLARPVVPALPTEQLIYALLELRPAEGAALVALPLNLCLVLDRSGSMQGRKIEALRSATAELLDLLGPQDTLSVIIFNNRERILVPAGPVTEDRKAGLLAEIRRIDADGGTKMAPAMEAGILELRKRMPSGGGGQEGQVTRLVLLTDGITEREKKCLEQADVAAKLDIPIVALGIGRDWNDKLMAQIGARTGGVADYVQDAEEIGRHFQRTVQQMQAVALQRASVHVHTATGVLARTVFRVHPLIARLGGAGPTERDVTTPLGEIERGHGQTLLVELIVPPRPASAYRIAQVDVSYDLPGGTGSGQTSAEILLTYAADPRAASPPDPRVMNLVEKVTAFKLQTRALEDLEAGNVQGATDKLQSAVTRLLSGGDVDLAATVQQEIDNLQKARSMSPEGRKTIRFGSGRTVRLDRE